ncbi:MAG: TVP38/TMEM64 family protein [Phycisphaeraceae bacterium]|nr:TVP38/TMEM64 family protein [Phycisphaeraceae bacterium]
MSTVLRTKRSKRLFATSVLAVLWGTTPPLWGFVLLAYLGPFSEWLRSDPDRGIVIFVAVFILAAGTGMLPTYAQAILGGWAFGFTRGFTASIIGFVGGAFVGWCISRLVAGKGVEGWLDSKPKARVVREALVNEGYWRTLLIVTLLRVPPNSPFALTNLAMSASGVRLWPYLIGTAIGMAPRTAVACWIAAEGASHAEDIQSLVREKGLGMAFVGVVIMAVCLGAISLIGRAALRRAMRTPGGKASPPAGPADRPTA